MQPEYWVFIGIAIFIFLVFTVLGIGICVAIRQDRKNAARHQALWQTDPERAQAREDELAQQRAGRRAREPHPMQWLMYYTGGTNVIPIVNDGLWGPLPSQRRAVPARRDNDLATVLEELRAQGKEINLTAPASNGPVMVISIAVQETNV